MSELRYPLANVYSHVVPKRARVFDYLRQQLAQIDKEIERVSSAGALWMDPEVESMLRCMGAFVGNRVQEHYEALKELRSKRGTLIAAQKALDVCATCHGVGSVYAEPSYHGGEGRLLKCGLCHGSGDGRGGDPYHS